MDPIANLQEQRELALKLADKCLSTESLAQSNEDVYRLTELVLALDKWRRNGGSDPYS